MIFIIGICTGMRDIKGLEERLLQLKTLLGQTERICEEQANNANSELYFSFPLALIVSNSWQLPFYLIAVLSANTSKNYAVSLHTAQCTG